MRLPPRLLATLALALAGAPSCQLVTDFSLTPVAELSDELCTDGRDNDFNDLVDCQDWSCLDKLPCCDIPEVILDDSFDDGPADCAASECSEATCSDTTCGPDASRWHTWPCPFPTVCDGALRLDKVDCFDMGVLSRTRFGMVPGLRIDVGVVGQPERRGHLQIALTLQDEADLPGALDPCGSNQRIEAFAAVEQAWADGGYRLVARFQQRDVAVSALVADPEVPHLVTIGIAADETVYYALDGATFAVAPVAIPPSEQQARLALTGLTQTAAFTSARVEAGIRCHDPLAWTGRGPDLAGSRVLVEQPGSASFDADEVFHPAVRATAAGIELVYTGCRWAAGTTTCDILQEGIGRAVETSLGFVRDDGNPILSYEDVAYGERGPDEMAVHLFPDPADGGLLSLGGVRHGIYPLDEAMRAGDDALQVSADAWDGDVCCMTALVEPTGTRRMWYSGRVDASSPAWRLGLATALGRDQSFGRNGEVPVLDLGPPSAFDSDAIVSPTIVFDPHRELYRMWYEARDFFGNSSIGYAVSTDGVTWSRFPGNPVITPETLGLATIGAPSVVLDDDGRLRMWVHGSTEDARRRQIFELVNQGALPVAP